MAVVVLKFRNKRVEKLDSYVKDQGMDLVELPRQGLALIVSNIRGNMDANQKIIEICEDQSSSKKHLILTEDFINAMGT